MSANTTISPQHWNMILDAIHRRACVPFLGAAVNISKPDGSYKGLPLGPEVARKLIEAVTGAPIADIRNVVTFETALHQRLEQYNLAPDLSRTWLENLPRVALHLDVAGVHDRQWLYGMLQQILDDTQCTPSPLLHALAQLPFRLIVTTNFDDLLERALDGAMRKAIAIVPADIIKPVNFAAALKQPPDAISAHLRAQLDPAITAQIDVWDGASAPDQALIDAIAAELNRIAEGPSLYDANLFPQASANSEIAPLLNKALSPDDQLRLNRLLLEAAYPIELRRARKRYQLVVQPMEGFEDVDGKRHAENPPPDDVLTVYKIHGSFNAQDDGMVITEDDYIHFLTVFNEEHKGIPGHVRAKLSRSALLFLGYSLEDWDFRTLYKAMVEPVPKMQRKTSFAIQWNPPQFWVDYWERKGVVIYNQDIHAFAEELERRYVNTYGGLSAVRAGV